MLLPTAVMPKPAVGILESGSLPGRWHAGRLVWFSAQPRRQLAIFQLPTLWLAEKIAQPNKNAGYALQNSRGRKLAVKRTHVVLKVGLPC